MANCSEPGCGRLTRHAGSALCVAHQAKKRRARTDRPQCTWPAGCTRRVDCKGLCANHYGQVRRNNPDRPRCYLPGCDRIEHSRGLCYSHDATCRRYNLTPAEYEAMLIRSAGVCAICGRVPADSLAVDHDHVTGAVRALLCGTCNFLIGQAQDDPDLLLSAAAYLMQFRDVLTGT
jgi:hypothetical protein